MGASVPETGSHPTGQAELHRLDASRFDPARGLPQTLAKCSRCGAPPYVELFPNGEGPTIPLWICAHHKMFGGECPSDTAYLSEDAWQEAHTEKQAFQLLADLHDALILTVNYRDYATVCDFVGNAAEFKRASDFLHASAIEAGTATTTEIGVVHESAASEAGDAQ